MAKLSGKTVDKELFLKLYQEKKRDCEISDIMNIDRSVVCYFRKHILDLPRNHANDTTSLTDLQKQIITGTLLGDASIRKGISTIFPKFTLCHCVKQKELLEFVCNELECLNFNTKEYPAKEISIRNKKCNRQAFINADSKYHRCLEEFRDTFYPKEIKIIPIPFLEKHFTPLSLAILFMDDGNKDSKTINLNL